MHPGIRYQGRMCRMLAVIGSASKQRQALEAFHPLGQHGVTRPWESPGHLDGWGIAKYGPEGAVIVARSAGDVAIEAQAYAEASQRAAEMPGRLMIAHLRKATFGAITPENAQPFCENVWLFCHNGCVIELEKLGPTPPMEGQTDSEEFFRRWCRENCTIDAYHAWVKQVAALCRYTSLTSFLSDGSQFLACRQSSGMHLDEIPEHFDPAQTPCAYTLHHWSDGDTHIVCSEKLPLVDAHWTSLANGEVRTLSL
jgi:predicted glutamine amidotransferase